MKKTKRHGLRFRLAALSLLLTLLAFLSVSPAGGLTPTYAEDDCTTRFYNCRDLYCYGLDCQRCTDEFKDCNLGNTAGKKAGKGY